MPEPILPTFAPGLDPGPSFVDVLRQVNPGALPVPLLGAGTAAPGSRCGATWRNRSANDGPGSRLAANNGNGVGSDIGPGA